MSLWKFLAGAAIVRLWEAAAADGRLSGGALSAFRPSNLLTSVERLAGCGCGYGTQASPPPAPAARNDLIPAAPAPTLNGYGMQPLSPGGCLGCGDYVPTAAARAPSAPVGYGTQPSPPPRNDLIPVGGYGMQPTSPESAGYCGPGFFPSTAGGVTTCLSEAVYGANQSGCGPGDVFHPSPTGGFCQSR